MMELMSLNILTPDKEIYSGQIKKLFTENAEGSFEVLPRHGAMITVVVPSTVQFIGEDEKKYRVSISEGVLTVKDNNISVACKNAEWDK
ncbi:hypothetical protein KQI89_00935 [Clostridium sp. MSJ-4]|uniref:ATP synthase F1 complex delta/epsilon subunit N-terminal domain-containing protein n=1 Tax=Clostridium simiarum TaxID=2841506 RepID=A0ABS6EVS3_9CLOT|nr:hypothetical protein [Clostridium simiarum]MBU5590323.1 hypothetical protein [Clostridium simiarum]